MDPSGRQEGFRGAFLGILPIHARYFPIFAAFLVPQLQLWQLHRLVTVHSLDEPVFTNGVGFTRTLPVSRRSYCYRNALASEV